MANKVETYYCQESNCQHKGRIKFTINNMNEVPIGYNQTKKVCDDCYKKYNYDQEK